MGDVLDIDIFFIQLNSAIESWYDLYYMDVDNTKVIHLETMRTNYEPERFRKTTNLHHEREKFLAEMHNLVWETLTYSY